MTKLTNWTRECIAKVATAFTFDPKQEALKQREDALAREAYAATFPKAETDAVNALPSNWVRRDACLQFNVGGERITLDLIDGSLPVPYRLGDYAGYGCRSLGAIEPGDLCDRIQAHAREVETTKRERAEAQRRVYAMLTNVTTVKKLRELWPEGEQFYAKYEAAPAPAVPAVRVEEINTMLGLEAS